MQQPTIEKRIIADSFSTYMKNKNTKLKKKKYTAIHSMQNVSPLFTIYFEILSHIHFNQFLVSAFRILQCTAVSSSQFFVCAPFITLCISHNSRFENEEEEDEEKKTI